MKGARTMSYGNGEMSDAEEREIDLEMLREDLVGELNAINQYQDHIESLENQEALHVLEHIRDDEKEHVAELTKLIQKLDATQAAKFKKEGL
jgi:rubrerythrin